MRKSDDLVEPCAVVRDEADAVDVEVVHLPAAARVVHPVVERQLPLGEEERRPHDRLVAVDGLAPDDHLVGAALVHPGGDVGALDHLGEQTTKSPRSAGVRWAQCGPRDRLAISPKSKISPATLTMAALRWSAFSSPASAGSLM